LDLGTVRSREALVKSWGAGYKLADILSAETTAKQIAECAGALALKLAHYQVRAWRLILEETLAMIDLTEPAGLGEAKRWVLAHMRNLHGEALFWR
jgi:hypothetical protein